jgi:hypothetical protein
MTVKMAAERMNVPERMIYLARVVSRHGIPELEKALAAGKVKVSPAAELARHPQDVQRQALAAILEGRARTVKEALGGRKETAYDRLKRAWNACSDDQRALFVAEMKLVD